MEDVMMNEVAKDSESSSVRALAVALPSPGNESSAPTDPPHEPWPVYNPTYVSHDCGALYANTSPCYYDFVPSARPKSEGRCDAPSFSPTTPNYAPPPPGRIDPAVATMFYGPIGEQNPREVWHGEMGIFGRIGLDCYNLQKGTNLQYLGLHDSMFTGVFAHHITAAAKDPIRNSNCKVETNVWFRKKKDCFTLHTNRCRMVPPAPADDYMGDYDEGNHEAELGMPDKWLPEDALTGSNKLQYYEMKESEVEQEKERLLLYAGFALFADYLQYTGKVLELGKVIVQTSEAVESKVKAKNAIFYVSFNIAGYDLVTFNGIVRRGTDGGPDRFTYEAKCFMDARQYR
ncbi:unnamed protein product [Thlaspi arvense]|uniref:Uncharacterized protein n=1 Tax=Thlaspi arvense TaxID=13288 RepID=A0AAU9SMM7_THLAR|nr:unnamed protein product [Thlaspi arvense]